MPLKNPTTLDSIVVSGRTGTGTVASSTASTITLNDNSFVITLDLSSGNALAAAAEHACTMTNANITANSIVLWSVGKGTSTTGTVLAGGATITANTAVLTFTNAHASDATNGTVILRGIILNTK